MTVTRDGIALAVPVRVLEELPTNKNMELQEGSHYYE
jgi:hypothetical protein